MFLESLKNQILLVDGAMGSLIQDLELDYQHYGGKDFAMLSDILVYSKPEDLIEKIHLPYLIAGANILETNTFGASPLRLGEFDFTTIKNDNFACNEQEFSLQNSSLEKITYDLNKRACLLANEAINRYKKHPSYEEKPLYVAGSIGPSNWVVSATQADLNKTSFEKIKDNFYHQVLGLIDGKADILLFETQQDILELKAAIAGAKKAFKERGTKLPIIAQVTVDQFSKMQIFNTDISSAYGALYKLDIDVFGINCTLGPELMDPVLQKIMKFSNLPISVIPNAGQPVSIEGKTCYPLKPNDMADYIHSFLTKYPINIVGGCCGTRPEHIKAIYQKIKNLSVKENNLPKQTLISGPQESLALTKNTFLKIGERLNVRGSKKVRLAVENENDIEFDALEDVALEQQNLGLDVIDICMDSNLVNTKKVLPDVIYHLTSDFKGIMCIDSFDVEALLKAVEVYPGRPIINSISLEEYEKGKSKIESICPLMSDHKPIYIALLADGKGPALTMEGKVSLAKQIIEECKKFDVTCDQLMIDINGFPIGSEANENDNFTLESLNAIEPIKALHPDIKTTIGVGNLTNGLAKKPYMRIVLTSVFLDEAIKRGLDAAILNPNHYIPIESIDKEHYQLAQQIIFDRDLDAFSQLEEIAEKKVGLKTLKTSSFDNLSLEEKICSKIKNGHKEKTNAQVNYQTHLYDYKDTIVLDVMQAMDKHEPLNFINDYLMKAMKDLGDGFGRGEVSLPHLLKSADVMKHCMNFLEQYMSNKLGIKQGQTRKYKGVVVIGTVYQDVHSIGKDLAKTLLENYGYKVIDLGVQVPLEQFIEQAKEHNADAIGMSALLVQTSNHMITVAKMMKEQQLDIPILIGGAPVNTRHASYVAIAGVNELHEINDKVFYCQSGMDGVNYMNDLMNEEKRISLLKENKKKLQTFYSYALNQAKKQQEKQAILELRQVTKNNQSLILEEPYSSLINFDAKSFQEHLDTKTLFALNWEYGSKKSWQKKNITEDILHNSLERIINLCTENNILNSSGKYAFFYAKRNDTDIEIYNLNKEKLSSISCNEVFSPKDKWYLAQYISEDSFDIISLQLTFCSKETEAFIKKQKENSDLETSFLLQGLADRTAEDLAEYIHKHCNDKIKANHSCRYSPGYPALTSLAGNKVIYDLLCKDTKLDITLTDANEFQPTSATGALVIYHQDATYS